MITNKLALALIEHLNLDPEQVTADGLQVEVSAKNLVTVRWQSVTWMTVEEFQRIVQASETKEIPE